jgi:hypothetical protein
MRCFTFKCQNHSRERSAASSASTTSTPRARCTKQATSFHNCCNWNCRHDWVNTLPAGGKFLGPVAMDFTCLCCFLQQYHKRISWCIMLPPIVSRCISLFKSTVPVMASLEESKQLSTYLLFSVLCLNVWNLFIFIILLSVGPYSVDLASDPCHIL